MTQATETTAERVQRIVYPWAGLSFGAEELGSEIDRLNADLRDVKLAYDAQAKLIAEARAQIDALTAQLAEAGDAYAAQGAILTAARYEAGRLGALLGEAKAENERLRVARHQSDLDWTELRKVEQSLRAEVERLRPAAKNWADHLAWAAEAIKGGGIPTADNAARAAKEPQNG